MKRSILSTLVIAIFITLIGTMTFSKYVQPLIVNLVCFANCMNNPVRVCLSAYGGGTYGYYCTSTYFEPMSFCCQYCGGGLCPQMPSLKAR
ncbi:MAG TPA: hypothetical protein ENO30_01805 [Thermodesulfobium narugense]|nr:hypothetical protein [Thermodesulfobium narugense]